MKTIKRKEIDDELSGKGFSYRLPGKKCRLYSEELLVNQ